MALTEGGRWAVAVEGGMMALTRLWRQAGPEVRPEGEEDLGGKSLKWAWEKGETA